MHWSRHRDEQVTTSGGPADNGVTDLTSGFEGTTAAGATLYHAPTTPEIDHDASAAEMEELLETLPSLGQVCMVTYGGCVDCVRAMCSTRISLTRRTLIRRSGFLNVTPKPNDKAA